jgi:hypothetical protein
LWQQSVVENETETLVQDLQEQLSQCVSLKGQLTPADPMLCIAIGNVWLLIEMGELANDEFNGLMCACEV